MFTQDPSVPPPDATAQTQPGVPDDQPKSYLKLAPQSESEMVRKVIEFVRTTEKEMGRLANGETEVGSHLWNRKRNMEMEDNNYEWRKMMPDSVFADGHNFTRGKSKQINRIMSAKLTEDIVGTTPFWGAIPARAGDPELVKNVEAFVQGKTEQAGIPKLIGEAITTALTRDEAILHVWYEVQVSKFVGPATVAVDPMTNEPLRTPVKQLYVYPNDDMIPNPAVQGEVFLKKDPSFVITTQLKFVNFDELPQEEIVWDGLRGAMLDNRDFICPLNYDSIHEAKFVAWRYDREWEQMREQYRGFDVAEGYFTTHTESAAKSGDTKNPPQSDLIAYVHAAEVYIRMDVDGDGVEEDIMLVIDMENERAIFYDYMRNHMKKRPFEVIPGLRRKSNSWSGVGVYTETLDANTFIDLTLNRVNKKDSQTGSATFIQAKSTDEWVAEAPLIIGGPEYYHLRPGFNDGDNKPCFRIPLIDVSEYSMMLSDKSVQDLELMFGVSTAASASASSLDRSRTATGNAILEKEGDLIVSKAMKVQVEAIVEFLKQCVDIVLEHMDPTELILTKEAQLIQLNREEIRGIDTEVQLILTKSRSAEGLATSQQATTLVLAYMDLPPPKQKVVRDFFVQQLRALQVADADEKISLPTDADILAYQQQSQNIPQPPANASVSAKLADFTPEEQAQIKSRDYKIQPSSPAEAQAFSAQQDAQEAATKLASTPKPEPKTIPMNPKEKAA